MPREQFEIELTDAYDIAPSVRHFVFACPNTFDYIPGQFVNIHFDFEEQSLQRSYSVATIPDGTNGHIVEIAIAYVDNGRASRYFASLQPGSKVMASGPAGRLVLLEEHPKRYVFIATGTGVAPYRAMLPGLEAVLKANPEQEVVVLMGARKLADLIYQDDFLKMANTHPNFYYIASVSQEKALTDTSYQRLGRVTAQLDGLNLNPENDVVYLCGNPAMVDDAFQYLKEKEFNNRTVKREKYVFGK